MHSSPFFQPTRHVRLGVRHLPEDYAENVLELCGMGMSELNHNNISVVYSVLRAAVALSHTYMADICTCYVVSPRMLKNVHKAVECAHSNYHKSVSYKCTQEPSPILTVFQTKKALSWTLRIILMRSTFHTGLLWTPKMLNNPYPFKVCINHIL